MSFILGGSTIKGPNTFEETNSTLLAEQRVLSGAVGRDYFGSNKRVWRLDYKNVNTTSFTTINNVYQTYLTSGTAQTWHVTETNYTISSTNVHIDLLLRGFNIRGSSYISDFTLVLTEA